MPIVWNGSLVALSVLIAIFGSLTALSHARRMRESTGRLATTWLISGGITLGMTVWAMHFVGMLAFELPIKVAYDNFLTLVSILPAIGAALLGFYLVQSATMQLSRILVGGFFMGLGITAMHYTDMAALKMQPAISYDPWIFCLSVFIAITAAIGAMLIIYASEKPIFSLSVQYLLGAIVMGCAIAGMHYTAMLGTVIMPGSVCTVGGLRLEPSYMALIITTGMILLFSMGWIANLYDRRHALNQLQVVHEQLKEHGEEMRLLASVFDVQEGIIITDPDQVVLRVNPAFTQLTGYSVAEMLGRTPACLKSERHEVQFYEDMSAHLEQKKGWAGEIWITRKDGEHRLNWLNISAVAGPDGQITNYVATFSDITELDDSRKQLKLLETCVSRLNDIVMITEAGPASEPWSRIVFVNDAFARRSGYRPDEVLGKTPHLLEGPKTQAAELKRIHTFMKKFSPVRAELINYAKSGEDYWVELDIVPVIDKNGICTHWVTVARDVTERKLAEHQIHRLAFYDPLTNLPNRRLLFDRLQHATASSMRTNQYGAVLFIDLDNFKTLNDTMGHKTGDLMLLEVGTRLLACMRKCDTVARLGGDEFVVMLENLGLDEEEAVAKAKKVAEKVGSVISEDYLLDAHEYHSNASIGISLFRGTGVSADELLKQADTAMYESKHSGRNTLSFFDPDMLGALEQRATLEADLRHALAHKEFVLYFQVQVDRQRRIFGAEVLLRWQHPQRKLVLPAQFIPLAEETGLILPIGHYVLEAACQQLRSWEGDAVTRDLVLSVNVSARQFKQPDFVDQVREVLRQTKANPQRLKIELTETTVINNVDDVLQKMKVLQSLGVSFSMDDFGTGYSSLSFLKQLPLDQLKIDRSFVSDIAKDTSDAVIVKTIIAMGNTLELDVISEGVETEAQFEMLKQYDCPAFQGYLFGKPQPIADFEEALRSTLAPV